MASLHFMPSAALGKPIPQTRDREHVPSPPNTCPAEDPPIFVDTDADEITVDIAVAHRLNPRNAFEGVFTVAINPLVHTIRPVGSTIYTTGTFNQRLYPSFNAYLRHLDRTPEQGLYTDRWEIGVDSEMEVLIGTEGHRDVWYGANPRVDMMVRQEVHRERRQNSWQITWESFRQWATGIALVPDAHHHCGR